MAADVFEKQFTRIHNALFRDKRLSFKAKGIFGLISTHKDGFGISEGGIASFSTDGISAVNSGLKELIAFRYLQRDRKRDELGRLGEAEYFITDMPDGLVLTFDPGTDPLADEDLQTGRSEPTCENLGQAEVSSPPRSEPECDFPIQADPALENRPHKKTSSSKKTTRKKTNRPSVPVQHADDTEDGGMDGSAVPHQISRNEGVDLLLAIGAENPKFLLTGKTLRDQGLTVLGMLDVGWTADQLREVIAGRPLPDPIRTSVGAVISSRLRQALSSPVPGHSPDLPAHQQTPTPDPWTSERAEMRSWSGECEGEDGLCGRPTDAGERLCGRCANSKAEQHV